jgi:hypothetical protein
MWAAIIDGRLSREAVHDWAEPFMLGDRIDDLMVGTALQYLHGFDLTTESSADRYLAHGPPGRYIRSVSDITEERQRWRACCAKYDADPAEFVRLERERAQQIVADERARRQWSE